MIRSALRRKIIAALAVVAGLALWAPQALAQNKCELTMTTPSQWVIRHDPFGDNQVSSPFEIQFSNAGRTPCVGRLEVTSVGNKRVLESRTSAQTVPFALRDESNRNNLTPGSSENLVGRTTLVRAGSTATGRITFTVIPPADIAAGRYTQTVTVQFRMPNGEIHSATDVTLVFEVTPSLIIGLAGEFTRVNGTPTLNLGDLTQNGVVPLNAKVYVRASSGYQVTVTSQNGGLLLHEQPGWAIPYGLRLGGTDINLGVPHVMSSRESRARVDDYPLRIDVRDIGAKRAGRYKDIIRFTVTAI
ncbi:hypothetical protein [Brevundimonas sp.]|uniref:hypothetical protein n=1 Tax=Brevundimonas sp. TaxID=1871086 RepID=UPI002FCA6746